MDRQRSRSRMAILLAAAACALLIVLAPVLASASTQPPNSDTNASTQPPNNDNYLDSIDLNAPGEPLNSISTLEDPSDTIGATVQTDLLSPCGRVTCATGPPETTTCDGVRYGRTVWYDFYPDQSGQVEIRAEGMPTVIALYTYDPHTLLPHEIQCASGSSYRSNELFSYVQKGTAYTYQIGGRDGADGIFQMLFNY